jgi:tyrosinase
VTIERELATWVKTLEFLNDRVQLVSSSQLLIAVGLSGITIHLVRRTYSLLFDDEGRSTMNELRVRRSLHELQAWYEAGNTKPLEDLWTAWRVIKELPADYPQSFFTLGGYHGEPFRGPGLQDAQYWGGYCNHGNVLFPTWHRVYMLKLEQALQSVPGCQDVMLPYWDETSDESIANGIPWALTREKVKVRGQTIANPLRSFRFNADIADAVTGQNCVYSKRHGYETVRYPLSGLVGTPEARKATKEHNKKFHKKDGTLDYDFCVDLLNSNVRTWLAGDVPVPGHKTIDARVADKYGYCLDAPNYTLFSNETSARYYQHHKEKSQPDIWSVEQPHDSIHLAVGGFELPETPHLPGLDTRNDFSPIDGANGDMGENDTAGLDPIFFFHHCFVDRVFWLWQKRQGFTDEFDIIADYPGTNSSDSDQGPVPGQPPNLRLTMDTPLDPFTLVENGKQRPYTSRDCINIETQLGYTYGPGSLEGDDPRLARTPAPSNRMVKVFGIDRSKIRGSFVVAVYGNVGGEHALLGAEAVLSRWNIENCANCQKHLKVSTYTPVGPAAQAGLLAPLTEDHLARNSSYHVKLHTHDGVIEYQPAAAHTGPESLALADTEDEEQPPFHFEIL